MSKKYKISDNQLNMFDNLIQTPYMSIFDKSRCEVKPINYETAARMVETYHYAHRVPSIVLSYGLYVDNVLAGCITYGIPPNRNMLLCCGDKYEKNALELNRLYIHDWAGKNSESYLIGQSFNLIPYNYFILISYADSFQSHIGIIYQATNWLYTGSGIGDYDIKLKNGDVIHSKNLYNMFGTRSIKICKEKLGNDFDKIIYGKSKHRYVYFLGSKSQKKTLRKALKWKVLPYPK